MNTKIKRIISFLVILTMLASLVIMPNIASAKDTGNAGQLSNDRANLSFVYLGKTAKADWTESTNTSGRVSVTIPATVTTAIRNSIVDKSYLTKTIDSDYAEGDIVWVGVQFSKMSKVRDLYKSAAFPGNSAGLDDWDSGLSSLTLSFWYDKSVVTPVYSGTATSKTFYAVTATNNIAKPDYVGNYDVAVSTSNFGDAKSAGMTSANESDHEYVLDEADRSNIESIIVSLSENTNASDSDPRMFQDTDSATVGDDPIVMAVVPFKILSVPAHGQKVLQGALSTERFNTTVGWDENLKESKWAYDQDGNGNGQGGAYATGVESDYNLKNYFNITNPAGTEAVSPVVDIFPAGEKALTKLEQTNATFELPAQFVGNALAFSTTDAEKPAYKATFDDTSTDTNIADDIVYMYGATDDITDATNLTAVPAQLTSTLDDKYLYATYTYKSVTKVVCLGQLDVQAKTISAIDIKTTGTGDNTTFGSTTGGKAYYTGDKVLDLLTGTTPEQKLIANVRYNSAPTTDVPMDYADFAANGIKLVKQSATGELTEVTATTELAEGANTFRIVKLAEGETLPKQVSALTGLKSPDGSNITITATTKKRNLDDATAGDPDLKYAPAAKQAGEPADAKKTNTIDFKNVEIEYHMDGDATHTTAPVSTIGKSQFIFYIGQGNSAVPAENLYATTITGDQLIDSGVTAYDETKHKNKHIFAVPAGSANGATPIYIGQLGTREVKAAENSATTSEMNVSQPYGKAIKDIGGNLYATFNNNDQDYIPIANLDDYGVTMKVVKGSTETDVTEDTVLTPDMTGAKLAFYKGTTKIGETALLTVDKKTAKITFVPADGIIIKTYDGKDTIADQTIVGRFEITGVEAGDTDVKNLLAVSGLTFKYNNKTANTNKAIVIDGYDSPDVVASTTAPTQATTEQINDFKAKYNIVLDTDAYTVANGVATLNGRTGTIEAKTLTLKAITEVPSLKKDDTTPYSNTKTIQLTAANTDDLQSDATGNVDDVKLTYKFTYPAGSTASAGTPDIEVAISGETGLGLSGDDAANYTPATTVPATKGSVTNKNLTGISVTKAPTKATSTYPDTKLDLTGLEVTLDYDGTAEVYTLDELLNDPNAVVSFTDANNQLVNITKDNKTDAVGVKDLKVGSATTITVKIGDQTATTPVTVNKKQIRLSDITFNPEKVYDGNTTGNVTPNATFKDGDIEEADGGKIKVNYTTEFADPNAGEGKNATISAISLAPVTEGDKTYENYVIVDDNGTPIAANATTTTQTGTIEKAKPNAPAKPTVTVDNATNNITVTEPLSDANTTYQYSNDGGNTWQDEPVFEFKDLRKNTTYPIAVRVKATPDGNYDNSDASETTNAKTFKNYVEVRLKNKDVPVSDKTVGYTDEDYVKSNNDVHAILVGGKPSRFKNYFTDAAATQAVDYTTNANGYALTDNTILYMTQTSGGGSSSSSGTSTYIVKFAAGTNGTMSGKTSVSVSSGEKLSTSNVPTITANDGYTFKGWSADGTTVVDPTAEAVTKSITYTALYEEATEPTVAPTTAPQPTDAPVIDENYTKPYASGYEDESFRADGNITRAELASMIARLSYKDDLPDGTYYSTFSDVADDAWYAKYVGYLEGLNVLSGYEDGTFRPENPVTRGEISSVIARAQRFGIDVYTGMFSDVTEDDWAKDYIQTLANRGIASGYEDGTFNPYGSLTRAEAVTMINKVLAPSEAIVTFTPNDIFGHWAYDQIILAVNERRLTGAAPEMEQPAEPEVTEAPAEEATTEATEEATEATETTEETPAE